MLKSFFDFVTKLIPEKVAEAIGSAIVAALLATPLIAWLIRILRRRTIRTGSWHTTFIKDGQPRVETVELKFIPIINHYYGRVVYDRRPGEQRHYLFSGRLSETLFTATYISKELKTSDCGAWTLKLNNAGTALVGAYVWQEVNDEIGHDFYQWTEAEFDELLQINNSLIHGNGIFLRHDMPKGALVGEFRGNAADGPTRESIQIDGRHIDPAHDCKLRSLNHSCNPNAKFVGALLFLTDAVGESEITIDYRSTETAFQEAFFCRCPTCMKEKRKVKIGHTA
jgi:hypothetical protein